MVLCVGLWPKASVPKNLAFLIPEILARPAIAGRARTLPVPPVGRPVGRREEDVRNAKATRIEILLKAGHSKAEVARLAGVSLRSVNRIAEETPVVHVDDAAEREKRRIGRPSIVEDFWKPIVKILEEKPALPSLEILRRVREVGYQGGKTALYALANGPTETGCGIRSRGPTKSLEAWLESNSSES
jgi:hypothetical protein